MLEQIHVELRRDRVDLGRVEGGERRGGKVTSVGQGLHLLIHQHRSQEDNRHRRLVGVGQGSHGSGTSKSTCHRKGVVQEPEGDGKGTHKIETNGLTRSA